MPEAQVHGSQEEGESTFKSVLHWIGIFMMVQFVMGQIFGNEKQGSSSPSSRETQTLSAPIPAFSDRPDQSTIANATILPSFVAPIWPENCSLDLSVYISPLVYVPGIKAFPADSKIIGEKNFRVGDFSEDRVISTKFAVPEQVQNNGTLWAHFYVALAGHELDPSEENYRTEYAFHFTKPLVQYLPKKKTKKLKNLLTDTNDDQEPEEQAPKGLQISSFYHPNFTVGIVPDSGVLDLRLAQPAILNNVISEATNSRDASGRNGWYYPIVFLNTFWQLKSHMIEINSTVKKLPLNIHVNNMKNWKFTMTATIDENVKTNQRAAANGTPMPGGGDGSEFEMVKEILLDTNIYLLGTTVVVSILHMVFEMLAFKNDISHWRKKKDVVGTSVRSILANVFMQLVIFLYLLDNNENTSWMILATQGFGIALEAWKITKSVDVRLRRPTPGSSFSLMPYHIVFEDKHNLTETEQKTKEYDEIAFKHLYIIAVPLLLAYAGYSLVYGTHKSWYSFIIKTLVGSVYAYGFLMMVPSLYINYRLKSVAHMPGKALTYKFLNTFIDDLFAFTIKMPTLHRLATLRDDFIFFIWLYQSWKYRVDYRRVNEFGQGGESEDEEEVELNKNVGDGNAKGLETTPAIKATTTGVMASQESQRKRK